MSQMESQLISPRRINFSNDNDDDARHRIPVYLRIKPLKEAEASIKIIDDTTVETNHALRANKKATYSRVFNGSATQADVFEGTTAGLIKKFLRGANVMTFAYGVTSSGKTHTIMGRPSDPGILPRMLEIIFRSRKTRIDDTMPMYKPIKFGEVQEISDEDIDLLENFKATLMSKVNGQKNFDLFTFENNGQDSSPETTQENNSQLPETANCSIWISIYDIYNEVITDLLGAGVKSKTKALSVGQDSEGRTFVKNLIQLPVYSAAEAYSLLQFARQNLTVAKTKLNENSSRSHMVFNLRMVQWDDLTEPSVNQFVISDLAGSERQAKTGTSGVTLKQASAINNSLLVLGRCLEALRKKDKGIAAPFRDSKLTRMLNPFFTQGGYVSLIICINPSVRLQDETMDTIRFSAIASEIVHDPIKPLERLRQLRRLSSIGNSQMRVDHNADVERWQDAVIGTTVHDGVSFIEVRVDYFNDMARDILRAEKLLGAYEEEVESLRKKLKESQNSRENLRQMHMDQLKEQRNKFVLQNAKLEEFHTETRQALVEGFEEEIALYKEKYTKYREGYAKLKDKVNDKLWPEICLYRERFGYLPEFPPKDGVSEEEAPPENTIKYWQDKLQEKEAELLSLKTDSIIKSDQIESLQKELDDQRRLLIATESECRDSRKESAALVLKVSELEEQAASLRTELENKETFIDELSDLKATLQEVEENRKLLVAEHQIQINSLIEELSRLKAKRSESESQTRVKSVTQSARVHSRLIDCSARTPSRRRTPSLATGQSPGGFLKTPRRRMATLEER